MKIGIGTILTIMCLLPAVAHAQTMNNPSSPLAITDGTPAIGDVDDRSHMGLALARATQFTTMYPTQTPRGLITVGYAPGTQANRNPVRLRLADVLSVYDELGLRALFVTLQTRTSDGRTVTSPQIVYSDGAKRLDIGVQGFFGDRSGGAIAIRHELTGVRRRASNSAAALRNAFGDVARTASREGFIILEDGLRTRAADAALTADNDFLKAVYSLRYAISADARFFDGGNAQSIGLSASRLFSLHTNHPSSGVTILGTVRGVSSDLDARNREETVRGTIAAILQDRTFFFDDKKRAALEIPNRWRAQIGIEYGIKTRLDAAANILGFVRFRDPVRMTELRLIAGRNYSDNGFVGVAIGTGFSLGRNIAPFRNMDNTLSGVNAISQ